MFDEWIVTDSIINRAREIGVLIQPEFCISFQTSVDPCECHTGRLNSRLQFCQSECVSAAVSLTLLSQVPSKKKILRSIKQKSGVSAALCNPQPRTTGCANNFLLLRPYLSTFYGDFSFDSLIRPVPPLCRSPSC